jgi:hypothetical protein
MKSVNRKVLMTLLGVVLATPFFVIALVVSIHAVAHAENVRAEMFFVALALIGVAIRIADGHFAVTGRTERAERGYGEPKHNTDLRGASTISPGY